MRLASGILLGVLGASLGALWANEKTVGIASMPGAGVPMHAAWHEVKWPFPLDEWGTGHAFRCEASDCGGGIDLYLRAKVGFCNCTTGVSDNADLDRVSDIELYSETFRGLTDGHAVDVGRLKGRSRLYHVTIPYAAPRDILAIAFNDQCDVAVATVAADGERLANTEALALDFLKSDPVQRWARAELGQSGL
ncbi:MAG TPA: hypothetical protein VKW08_00870 [Xanthobacteraceae bacterium]|jgi:hypothetical protein|nr:hypothetical protein [Xanthobacteraceae bacterium]